MTHVVFWGKVQETRSSKQAALFLKAVFLAAFSENEAHFCGAAVSPSCLSSKRWRNALKLVCYSTVEDKTSIFSFQRRSESHIRKPAPGCSALILKEDGRLCVGYESWKIGRSCKLMNFKCEMEKKPVLQIKIPSYRRAQHVIQERWPFWPTA